MHLGCPVRYVEAAQRFICPCHGGVYDFQGSVVGGPPVRPLDRFYTRVRNGQVEVGPRYSVNSRVPAASRPTAIPAQDLDGIGQYLYPGRFSTPEEPVGRMKLPKPPVPTALQPKPKRPGEAEQAKPLEQAKEAGDPRASTGSTSAPRCRAPRRWVMFRKVPKGTNWFYTLGSATLFAFLSQAVTGVFLAMYYDPSPTRAYESARYITNDVFLGEFVRGMHKWGSTVMVILIFLHMARTFFFGAYKYPRELNWVIGVVLLILTFVMSLTGYLLPFDQRSYWATIVAVNINGTGPLVGPFLSDFLRGGAEFGATTLSRFYAIHMLLVPGRDRRADRRAPLPRDPARHHGAAVAEGRAAARSSARSASSVNQREKEALPPRVLAAEGEGEAVLPVRGREGLADGVHRDARRSSDVARCSARSWARRRTRRRRPTCRGRSGTSSSSSSCCA